MLSDSLLDRVSDWSVFPFSIARLYVCVFVCVDTRCSRASDLPH